MSEKTMWASLGGAAAYIDVSPDTILRRAVPWPEKRGMPHYDPGDPVPGKVRWKFLKLGEHTRQDRKYYVPDLEQWLVTA